MVATQKYLKSSIIFLKLGLLIGTLLYTPASMASDLDLEKKVFLADTFSIDRVMGEVAIELRKRPSSGFLHYLMSHLYIRTLENSPADLNLLKKAKELAEQSFELSPADEVATVSLVNLYLLIEQEKPAINMLSQYMRTYPHKVTWRTYMSLAKVNTNLKNFDTANFMFQKSLSKTTNSSASIVINQYNLFLNKHTDPQNRIALLKNLRKKYKHVLLEEFYAFSLLQGNNHRKSIAVYKSLLKNPSQRFQPYANLGITLYQKNRNPQQSIRYLDKAIDILHKADLDNIRNLKLHRAIALSKLKKFDKSKEELRRIFINNNVDRETLAFVKDHYKNNPIKFSELLEEVVKHKGSSLLYAVLGETYLSLNNDDKAIQSLQNAVAIDEKKSDYYSLLGVAYYKKQNYEMAISQLVNATKLNPKDSLSYYNLACILSLNNRQEDALVSLSSALKLNPDLSLQASTDRDLIKLRSTDEYIRLLSPPPAIPVIAH